eukprot:2285603-Lingulodinium_polyedra.AAC.1
MSLRLRRAVLRRSLLCCAVLRCTVQCRARVCRAVLCMSLMCCHVHDVAAMCRAGICRAALRCAALR